MKETTTTIVTTEVTRRAPRKKTIVGSDHLVADGKVYVAAHYNQKGWPGEGHGIRRVTIQESDSKIKSGLTNSMGQDEVPGSLCLSSSLLHLAAIRNGLCDMASRPEASMLDKDDSERLKIIAVQINEFIPILKDIMTKRISHFAAYKFPIF